MSAVDQAKTDRDHVPLPVAVSLRDANQSVIAGTLNNERDVNFASTTSSTSDRASSSINHSIYAHKADFNGHVNFSTTHYHGNEHSPIRDWLLSLSPLRFEDKQYTNTEIASRGSGAGRWLLESEKFLKWRDSKSRKLLCYGNPGAGKTIIASIIINHLDEFIARQHGRRMACIYVYFDYRDRKRQDLTNLLASLLEQLVRRGADISPEIKKQHEDCRRTKMKPTSNQLLHMLDSQVKLFSKVYIVIDALDECLSDLNANTLDNFLNALKKLPNPVHLLFLSREDRSIELKVEVDANSKLEIVAKDQDIRRYVKSRIDDCGGLQRMVKMGMEKDKNFLPKVYDAVVEKCQGMFLLARLHMDFQESRHTLEHFESGLSGLPQTPNGVYKMAMERILGQNDPFKRTLAVKALTWLVFAERPLKLKELIQALSVNISDKTLPTEERLVTEDILTSSCAGIVVVDQATKGVRLAHYTVKQYLKENEEEIFKYAQSNMAGVCLVYLSFDEFRCVPETKEELLARQEKYPFLSYAANHWGYHIATGVEDEVYSLACNFLSKTFNVKSSLQVMNDFRVRYEADVTGLHLAIYFGLKKLATELLKRGVDVNKTTQREETALHWAVSYGKAEFVQLLVEQYADLNIQNNDGETALQKAIVKDDIRFVNALLSSKPKPNLELKDSKGRTPLTLSAACGKTAMVKILLANGAEVDGQDKDGWSALHVAASNISKEFKGHQRVMNLLIKSGASVEKPDGVKWTMLRWAAQQGLEDRIREMIGKRVDLNAIDDDGLTALHWAIKYRHETTAWILIRHKANINKSDNKGDTPLHLAVRLDDRSLIWLLLENGADVNMSTKSGETPLHLASASGHSSVVWLLLEKGANANISTKLGWTPLQLASASGHSSVVWLLLEKGANANMSTKLGKTPLHLASASGNSSVVSFLLEKGANANISTKLGWTPLHLASASGHTSVVRLLLEKGANWQCVDNNGRTALHHAVTEKRQPVVRVLIERVEDSVNAQDDEKQTALHFAASAGNLDLTLLLLEHKASIDSQDIDGYTPLHRAVCQNHEEVVFSLVKKGANVHVKDVKGFTALDTARSAKNTEIKNILLSRRRLISRD